jgi:hypothetical protein
VILDRGDLEKAKAEFEALWAEYRHSAPQYFGFLLGRLGHEAEARALIADMSGDSNSDPVWIFWTYYGLKDYNNALVWLRRTVDDRNPFILQRPPTQCVPWSANCLVTPTSSSTRSALAVVALRQPAYAWPCKSTSVARHLPADRTQPRQPARETLAPVGVWALRVLHLKCTTDPAARMPPHHKPRQRSANASAAARP